MQHILQYLKAEDIAEDIGLQLILHLRALHRNFPIFNNDNNTYIKKNYMLRTLQVYLFKEQDNSKRIEA